MSDSNLNPSDGAQILEAVDLNASIIEKYFAGTFSRVAGIGVETIAEEALLRHRRRFPEGEGAEHDLDVGRFYQWRKEGEYHEFNPHTIA